MKKLAPKKRPTKYKWYRKLTIFFLLLSVSLGVILYFYKPNITQVFSTETIRHDQELLDKVSQLESKVTEFEEIVKALEDENIRVSSWTEPLLNTNTKMRELVDESQAQVRELQKTNLDLLHQNQDLLEQNERAMLTITYYKNKYH